MGSKTTVKNEVPPPTAAELELQRTNLDIAKQQLAAIQKQTDFQQKQFDLAAPIFQSIADQQKRDADLIPLQSELARSDLERAKRLGPIQDELIQRQLEEVRRGGAASPEQIALIKQATDSAIATGESDIERFRGLGLEQIREELAPSRGLRPTDTPIQDTGFRLGEEAQRQQGQLVRDLRGAEANARLNFPLAQGQFVAGVSGFQQNLSQAARDFQAQLRQQAYENRLRLTGQAGAGGLGLTGAGGSPLDLQRIMAGERAARGTTTQNKGFGLAEAGQLAGGIGGILSGIGAISSKKLKSNKSPTSKHDLLKRLSRLNVEEWNYNFDKERHIGPYAEDFRDEIGIGDGETINLMDAVGVLIASVQALNERVTYAGI